MHERTQRAVARLLFAFACALPTSLTTLMVIVTFTPWYQAWVRERVVQELSDRTGLLVQVDQLEYPAPGTVRLTGVRLVEPETLAEVARVRIVTWINTDQRVAVRLSQPELQSARLAHAWKLVHDRFLCQPHSTKTPIRLAADDLTIHSQSGSTTLREVAAWLRPVESGVEASLKCLPANASTTVMPLDADAFTVQVIRQRTGTQAATQWSLSTGNVPLVCSALADYFPVMQRLGSDATFSGTMKWRVTDSQWDLDLGGSNFENIELSQLVRGTPYRLTGRAALRLSRCRLEPGQQLDVAGSLISDGGHLSHSLLEQLQQGVQLAINPDLPPAQDWPYEALALRFDFFGSQMTLEGSCHRLRGWEGVEPGVAVISQGRSLCALQPEKQSYVGLIRSLWPERGELLPLSSQTAWLLKILPPPPQAIGAATENGVQGFAPRITSAGPLHGEAGILQPE